jgi:hypothetical protein
VSFEPIAHAVSHAAGDDRTGLMSGVYDLNLSIISSSSIIIGISVHLPVRGILLLCIPVSAIALKFEINELRYDKPDAILTIYLSQAVWPLCRPTVVLVASWISPSRFLAHQLWHVLPKIILCWTDVTICAV